MNKIKNYTESIFDSIKHIDEFTDFLNQDRQEYENNTLGNAKIYGITLCKMLKDKKNESK